MKLLSTCFVSFLAMAAITAGCNKSGNNNPPPPPPGGDSSNVYFAGRADGEPAGPAYWKGEQQINLNAQFGGDAFSITVQGSNVYLGGRAYLNNAQSNFVPCFWQNGTRKDLPVFKPGSVGIVKSVRHAAGVTYGGGFCSDSLPSPMNKWVYQPVIWKSNDNEPIVLEPLYKDAFYGWNGLVEGIATISNSNKTGWVATGTSMGEEGFDDPCYWSAGLAQAEIPDGEHDAHLLSNLGYGGSGLAVSMTLDPQFAGDLSQSDILIAGFIYNEDGREMPCYWHLGGSRHDLSKLSVNGNGVATAIFSGTGGTLVAGYCTSPNQGQIPCYWKNGTRTDLPVPADGFGATAVSIFSYKGDIYVGGTINLPNGQFPCLWKNGQYIQHTSRGIAWGMTLGE